MEVLNFFEEEVSRKGVEIDILEEKIRLAEIGIVLRDSARPILGGTRHI